MADLIGAMPRQPGDTVVGARLSLAANGKWSNLISMRLLLVISATILAVSAAPSAASSDRTPYLCGGPDVFDRGDDGTPPPAPVLVGTYRCSEGGVTVTLRLDADGRFEERMEGEGVRETGDHAAPAKRSTLSGRWQVEGWTLRFFQDPTREPFKQRARVADARGHSVIVPFGIAGAILRRTKVD